MCGFLIAAENSILCLVLKEPRLSSDSEIATALTVLHMLKSILSTILQPLNETEAYGLSSQTTTQR
jgi:hypothetical protein